MRGCASERSPLETRLWGHLKIGAARRRFAVGALRDLERESGAFAPSLSWRYRAVVVLFMAGGCASFNMLVPHSRCGGGDLYDEYARMRGNVALPKSGLLRIGVPGGTQPCDTFGVHPSLRFTVFFLRSRSMPTANAGELLRSQGTLKMRLRRDRSDAHPRIPS